MLNSSPYNLFTFLTKNGDILEEKFKIKPLTKSQIIISLDRLTRFKFTEDKYLRVFKDIISSNLIYPKYKKSELDLMDYDTLTELAEKIINFSLNKFNSRAGSLSRQHLLINKKLLEYEKSVFKLNKNVEKLLKNKINYEAALTLLAGGIVIPPYDLLHSPLPLNLKWLKSLVQDQNQVQNRIDSGLKFPLEKVVIVEGITEEILLPKFAKIYGYDFDKNGIHLISAGGKKQAVRLFYQFADILKLPIFVLLDKDAEENFCEILPKLRAKDKVHILSCGEFEDTLPLNLIKRTLNRHFKNYFQVQLKDLKKDMPMTQILEELFKERGLEFKKAEFAALICENIENSKDVSQEAQEIIQKIAAV